MISCMGDGPEQNGRGSFILIDGKEFKVKGTYSKTEKDVAPFGWVMYTSVFKVVEFNGEAYEIQKILHSNEHPQRIFWFLER